MALVLTLITGLFILFGMGIVFLTKNNQKVVNFSISMAFGVMTMLVILELLPEAIEMMGNSFSNPLSSILLIGFIGLGILLLKALDLFIPDHESDGTQQSVQENLEHIGIVSSIALVLHNIIEGMAIYSTVTQDASMGLLVMIGVGLHNIPMGILITSTLNQNNTNVKKTVWSVILISLSTFFGGLIMLFLSRFITDLVLGILLAITLGMLIYIILFELLGEIIHQKQKKISLLGIGLGILIFLCTLFFE